MGAVMKAWYCFTAIAVMFVAYESIADDQKSETSEKNLLVNGGFEIGPEVDDFLALDPCSTAIKGWTVTRARI